MAFQPVPDVARFTLVHDNSFAVVALNVLYFRNPSQWGLPELISASNVLANAWASQVMPLMAAGARFIRVEARGERGETDVSYQLSFPIPVGGGVSSDPLPLQCAVCVTHVTGFTGRSSRGRTYFPFIPESRQSAGILTPGAPEQYVGALEYIRSEMAAEGWTHVVVSRYSNKQRRDVAQTLTVVGYRSRDNEVDTQRRRTRANAP